MAPVITLVRHAQGFHNLTKDYETYVDAMLTPLGKNQCLTVHNTFPHHNKVSHILVSPLRRTIETGYYCFKPVLDRGVKLIAIPEVVENDARNCNIGHSPQEIIAWAKVEFNGDFLDEQSFRQLEPYWYEKTTGLYEHTEEKLKLRASVARDILRKVASTAGEDAHIIVVSHSQFLPYLVGEPEPQWGNAEWRSYTIQTRENGESVLVRI